MQPQTSESLRAWFKNVEPVYAELFNAAHAMCGNYDLAEYALRSAIMDTWLENASPGMGFRERLRAALRREAMTAALSDEADGTEFTWSGLSSVPEGDALLCQLAREPLQTQRLAMLQYGCGLPSRVACQLAGIPRRQARLELERFKSRCQRLLPAQARGRVEALIGRRLKKLLGQNGPDMPQPSQVYRAFEAEALGAQSPGRRVSRVLAAGLLAVVALLCAGAFWLFAVLVQPV